jgi:uncharacterized protein (DUF4415 family)
MKKASKKSASRTKIVQWHPKPGRPPRKEERAELEALSALPDDLIDTSDISELPESVWREGGVRGMLYRPIKRPVTIRLDADVIEWLKSKSGPDGKGYQTAANKVLRSRMVAEYEHRSKSVASRATKKAVHG